MRRITVGTDANRRRRLWSDRLQRVDGMQLPTRLVRVVHPARPKTQLESQFGSSRSRWATRGLIGRAEVSSSSVDHDFLDGVLEFDALVPAVPQASRSTISSAAP